MPHNQAQTYKGILKEKLVKVLERHLDELKH